MRYGLKGQTSELLRDVQCRVPAGQQFAQEAFTSEHRRPVLVKLSEVQPDTFYFFDEELSSAFFDAALDVAARQGGGRLTVSYTVFGELRSQKHRLQHLAGKLDQVRALSVSDNAKKMILGARIEVFPIANSPLAPYRIVLIEGRHSLLFICRETHLQDTERFRNLGFFTTDEETIDEICDDIDSILSGVGRQLSTFERLRLLHQTTQQVTRELESYSRRVEMAVKRAQRRPDLLTPARFNKIVGQAINKMEQLKDIPRRALRSIEKSQR